ncbi:BatA domain-containing protein [Bremerella sp. JC817]|uniref:BatA domain-containing protein n=1 Tax=Bremerella sp. JC817 TaxID=3231756 RepID=UPI00345A016E
MQFANVGLLLGGLLIAVPIVLHLVMRQQPKQLEFPALRFVRQRSVQNTRRLQLKHWVLLALRCLAVLVLVAALARPGVASAALGKWVLTGSLGIILLIGAFVSAAAWLGGENRTLAYILTAITALVGLGTIGTGVMAMTSSSGPIVGEQEAPVAAVIIADTSPRMLYRHQNQTRLEKAQELGMWLTSQLPEDSEMAILDQRGQTAVFAPDRGAARQALQRLEIAVGGKSLIDLTNNALDMLQDHPLARKEIYVLTDLAAPAWDADQAQRLKAKLAEQPDIPLYIVDVGADDVRNVAISDLVLSSESVSENEDVMLQAEVVADGSSEPKTIELFIEKQDDRLPIVENGKLIVPEATRRNRQTIELVDGQPRAVPFRLPSLTAGTHHGWVELLGDDGLSADNKRWFTIEARTPWSLLVVESANAESRDLVNALAPRSYRDAGRGAFQVEIIKQDDLTQAKLDEYQAVVLLDPGPMPDANWESLESFVQRGGGLMLFLGRAAVKADFDKEAPQSVLPGKLSRQWRAGDNLWYLDPREYQHVVLSPFRDIGASVPWREFPVDRFWSLTDIDTDSNTIVPFSNGAPALIEQRLGKGIVLTFLSSVSDPTDDAWNTLFTGFQSWPFFVLSNQMARYVVRGGEQRFNYTAGDVATVETAPGEEATIHLLFTPNGLDPQEVVPDSGTITIPFTSSLGTYRVRPRTGGKSSGFSVNLPPFATRMEKLTEAQLDDILGAGRYRLARQQEQIVREQGKARLGVPLFPWLMLIVVIVFGLENVLANRFYRQQATES